MEKLEKFRPYFLNLGLIWLAILLYTLLPYYQEFLRHETKTILFYLALAYTSLGFLYYYYTPKEKIRPSKGILIFNAIKKSFSEKKLSFDKTEKTALLFIIVKFFFLPIMLNFFLDNYFSVKSQLPNLIQTSSLFSLNGFNFTIFPFLLALFFLIDTLWFAFGYAFESRFLKNEIRSVEPTILGWVVALICYPPFNSLLTKFTNWYANEHVIFFNNEITLVARIIIILLLAIYVSATLALGTKSSNLTNRGIVSKGPYSVIRHPAYLSKNLIWWITIIPIASWPAIFGMAIWSGIYHLRTITEERHLSRDPDYIEYKKQVKYRYIPFVY
ncbi:TPA: DUF1295 domain-containing protein [archaeon]|nr:DUF1295 domain-containing protein [Candidatus Naiadarchaeales archaeon SRR2090153.bin1042]